MPRLATPFLQTLCAFEQDSMQSVLIGGKWRKSLGEKTFQSINPATREVLPDLYPVSPWAEVEEALQVAASVAAEIRNWPGDRFATFLERYAELIEARAEDIIASANEETALPVEPRLKGGELPRTTNQLRQAAAAAREGSWALPTIDTQANIRSMLGPIGPVVVFGPNNFPFAFNGIAGGDGRIVLQKTAHIGPGVRRWIVRAKDLAGNVGK